MIYESRNLKAQPRVSDSRASRLESWLV